MSKVTDRILNLQSENKERQINENLDLSYLQLGDISKISVFNPFYKPEFYDKNQFMDSFVQFMRNPQYLHFLCKEVLNLDVTPEHMAIMQMLWKKQFPMLIASRGYAKSFTSAYYLMLRALLNPGIRIAVVGAAFRQALILFNYITNIWNNAPVLQDIIGKKNAPKRGVTMAYWNCGDSVIKFLPLGDGETIRGERAEIILAEEFNSIPTEVFETVIRGFAAVKTTNFIQNIKNAYRSDELKKLGIKEDSAGMNPKIPTQTSLGGNQIIIQGTASFQFGPFYKYFRRYKAIIESGGDQKYIDQNYSDLELDVSKLDTSQYAIMRLPYTLAPKGMLDHDILEQGKATMVKQIFQQEYGCVFPSDSDGFYPARLLFECTCPLKNQGNTINHSAKLNGDKELKYIMGIDPASEDDNFAISIIEDHGNYRVLVYTWSTNRKKFNELKETKLINDNIKDYNTFVIKHIRSLIRRFNIESIICDAGGGGISLKEGLHDPDKMENGDLPIYDKEDENFMHMPGLHMLQMINFQNSDWRKESHYGLKKDLEDKRLLFPEFDTVAVAQSERSDYEKRYESLDECYLEIENAKQEMVCIKRSETGNGQERWDVPKISIISHDNQKQKLKKDRFTSILLANYGVRVLHNDQLNQITYSAIGTTRSNRNTESNNKPAYVNTNGKKLRIASSPLVDRL